MSQNQNIDSIISMGRAEFSGKQQIAYDELIKPYIMMISNLAGKLAELQQEITLLKSTQKTKVIKKKSKK